MESQYGKPGNSYFLLRHFFVKRPTISCWPEKVPIPLTKEGREGVKQLAKKLKEEKIDLIFSSDLLRTKETAQIIAKELGLEVNLDERLRELNLGVYNGRKLEEFYRDFPKPEERFSKAPKNGENWSDCQKRMLDFIKEVDRKYQGKKVLIVGHGDPLWLLEGALKGLNEKELLEEKSENYIKMGEFRKIDLKIEL